MFDLVKFIFDDDTSWLYFVYSSSMARKTATRDYPPTEYHLLYDKAIMIMHKIWIFRRY